MQLWISGQRDRPEDVLKSLFPKRKVPIPAQICFCFCSTSLFVSGKCLICFFLPIFTKLFWLCIITRISPILSLAALYRWWVGEANLTLFRLWPIWLPWWLPLKKCDQDNSEWWKLRILGETLKANFPGKMTNYALNLNFSFFGIVILRICAEYLCCTLH